MFHRLWIVIYLFIFKCIKLFMSSLCSFYLLPSLQAECIEFVQIFEFRFLTDLHLLRIEKKTRVFAKCLSVTLSFRMWQEFCRCSIWRKNARNFTKHYIHLDVNKDWSWLVFGIHHTVDGTAVLPFHDLSNNLYPNI